MGSFLISISSFSLQLDQCAGELNCIRREHILWTTLTDQRGCWERKRGDVKPTHEKSHQSRSGQLRGGSLAPSQSWDPRRVAGLPQKGWGQATASKTTREHVHRHRHTCMHTHSHAHTHSRSLEQAYTRSSCPYPSLLSKPCIAEGHLSTPVAF